MLNHQLSKKQKLIENSKFNHLINILTIYNEKHDECKGYGMNKGVVIVNTMMEEMEVITALVLTVLSSCEGSLSMVPTMLRWQKTKVLMVILYTHVRVRKQACCVTCHVIQIYLMQMSVTRT